MQNLVEFITEKLKINKDTKSGFSFAVNEVLRTFGIYEPEKEEDIAEIVDRIEDWLSKNPTKENTSPSFEAIVSSTTALDAFGIKRELRKGYRISYDAFKKKYWDTLQNDPEPLSTSKYVISSYKNMIVFCYVLKGDGEKGFILENKSIVYIKKG